MHEIDVERLAYQLWERDGRQNGKSLEYWVMAEKLLETPMTIHLALKSLDRPQTTNTHP